MNAPSPREWLETDGLGGFASGNDDGTRSRRYHAWLLVAKSPPTRRCVLVNGADAWLVTPAGRFALSSQRYRDGVLHPDGSARLVSFTTDPWPTWTYAIDGDTQVVHELFVPHGVPAVVCAWRLTKPCPGARLEVRPFLSGRDYHALRIANDSDPVTSVRPGHVTWRIADALPAVTAIHHGAYREEPYQYMAFDYEYERTRGFDHREDLASPGVFEFDVSTGAAWLVFAADSPGDALPAGDAAGIAQELRAREQTRRATFGSRLLAAADSYIVRRGAGKTIIAGYPWFTDWGRDTFIALRGLCLATGRLADARDILCQWATHVSHGMLPNRFPDGDGAPEFNAADAALWFVVAAHELLTHANANDVLRPRHRATLQDAILAIVGGYANGTRHGIRVDGDHLLAAGEPGVQLTWMDAKVGDWVVTPRIGKPVELQALWCNALAAAACIEHGWRRELGAAADAFVARFWRDDRGYLLDVADVDHNRGQDDDSLRPNQVFAVGGLPYPLLDGTRARAVVDAVEAQLLTPLGLRSLAAGHARYTGRYAGDPRTRDAAYHNGTVWPWLLGPFVEAWVRVRGATDDCKRHAYDRFLVPLLGHLEEAGIGHISEVADGDAPHLPGGCPFQAWSVGEALRLQHRLLHTMSIPGRAHATGARPLQVSNPHEASHTS